MTLTYTGTYTAWGATSVTINNGGSLAITGNVTLLGSGTKFIVNSGGTLSISGSLTCQQQSRLTLSGGTAGYR